MNGGLNDCNTDQIFSKTLLTRSTTKIKFVFNINNKKDISH